jgi:hypothetical protein
VHKLLTNPWPKIATFAPQQIRDSQTAEQLQQPGRRLLKILAKLLAKCEHLTEHVTGNWAISLVAQVLLLVQNWSMV